MSDLHFYSTVDEVVYLKREIESQAAEIARLRLSEELAWGLIANSYHSDWNLASDEWQRSAARWRDKYHSALKETGK